MGINAETVTDVSSNDYPGHYAGEDHSWSLPKFRKSLKIQFHQNDPLECVFSLVGVDAAIANAFRRILIAEIPSVAIEDVFIYNNTSVIQDEVLAHRLGLIPFKAGRAFQDFLRWYKKPQDPEAAKPDANDYNTIVLKLQVECTRNEQAAKGEADPTKKYHNAHVYAHHIEFQPWAKQTEIFIGENAVTPVNPDILIAKLRPGQVIDVEMHAIKGLGSDHAKFSPVATASYRLLPTITITKPILGRDAHKFARCFPRGVIGIEKVTKKEASIKGSGYEGHEGEDKAVVKDTMKDTVSRECLRHEEFEGKVKLGRVRDHFIYSIESVGQWQSDELFLESIKALKAKCEVFKRNLATMAR